MLFTTANQTYQVEFRHRSKFGKHPELYAKSPVNAVTVCAISGHDKKHGQAFIALGTSICIAPDRWSRRTGRLQAFEDALEHCAVLWLDEAALIRCFFATFPSPPGKLRRQVPSVERRQALIDAGALLRTERAIARGAA